MANLKELRNRITSIGSTMKITSAMKMVSAAKLKKAQDAIVQMRPYASKLTEILQKASSTLDNSENAYGEVRDGNRVRMVVISSNRGLCGGFNTNICRKAKNYFERILKEGKTLKIFTVGSKGHDQLKRIYGGYIIEKTSFKGFKKIGEKFGPFDMTFIGKKEFELLLKLSGFKKWNVYGGFKKELLKNTSQEMVWVIKK